MNVQTVKKNKLPLLIHREEKLAIRNQKQCILQSLYKKTSCVVHYLKGEEARSKEYITWYRHVVSSLNPIFHSSHSLIYVLPSFVVIYIRP